ncbi:ribonuclease III [Propionivibrio limicola]|uniref:ribonuclease III n=1 Tax=Propionivibrio limicola TaxID=167645 RepID=UPI001291CF12|nr:ribonuclease III [Propionivibrio limicola]
MIKRLEQAIGYQFSDSLLLQNALTHRSHSSPHNERLEFLGDSILDAVVAQLLYVRFPELPEGDLSRLRANLVRQDSLHQLAISLSLGNYIRLGEGELKSGGAQRPSILADALEAIFGAVWLDGGFDAASGVIARLYCGMLDAIVPGKPIKDAKTRLQEYLQGKRLPLPKYNLSATEGEAHAQMFKVACEIERPRLRTQGHGSSRRVAEQMAAEQALKELKQS